MKRECYSLARGAAAAGSGYRRVDIRGLRAIKEARGSDQPPKENGERAQSCGDQEARRTTTQRNREIVSKHVTRAHTHTHTEARTQHRYDDTFDRTLSFLLSYRERVDFQYRSLPPCFARLTIPPAPFATSSSKRELAATSDSRDESIVVVSSRACRLGSFFPFRLRRQTEQGPRCPPVVRVDRKCGEEC